jgi:hypothetical protein
MISSRFVEAEDRPMLQAALDRDQFHPGRSADVFYEHGTITSLYCDEIGPVFMVRAHKALHVDLVCLDNHDPRNADAMRAAWMNLCEHAKKAGFKQIVTEVNGPALLKFCLRPQSEGGFGFERLPESETFLFYNL